MFVMASVRKVMKAVTATTEKKIPTAMKNLRPLSHVRQKSCRYMMCVTRAQSAKTPDRPPMAAVHGCLYAIFQTRNADNPTRVPKAAYPMLI